MKTRKTRKFFLPLVALSALALAVPLLTFNRRVSAIQNTGAIYTTHVNCQKVNGNLFNMKSDVYLNGGPQGGGPSLPDGSYYVKVTNPNGDLLLGKTLTASAQVSGGSFVTCYQLTAILYSASSGGTILGYDDTLNNGGEYKVWVSMNSDFANSDSKTDNFKVKESSVGPQFAISGIKYDDTNANGTLDPGEVGIQGVTINVILNGSTVIDPAPVTDANGIWLTIVPAGATYTACEVLPANYKQTGPLNGAQAFNLNSNLAATAQSRCWTSVGPVPITGADTGTLNFFNARCTKITCPANVTVECGTDTSPAATGSATALCANVTITNSDSFAAGCGNTGVITRTWTATDSAGNTDTCTQTITIVDTTKPVITGFPADTTVSCASEVPAANDASVTATDCSAVTVTHDADVISNKTCDNRYTITRTYHVTDACGNVTNRSQVITVNDTTAPTISAAGDNAIIYCPSQPVFIPPTAMDNCSTPTVNVISDVTTSGSCGTYSRTITWQARDACGNPSALSSQTIEVRCNNCGEGTMGFWRNKNGQDIIKGANQTALKTFLTQYAPFQDLGTQVIATYVTNVVNAASASGTAMNAMLKAQMLSTALDVKFGKVLGTANIDLTHINKPIGSATYEVVSSSFNGASCMSVNGMLTYAASQSNIGGTVWYAQVKNGPNSQELAKDAFDAINNQKAFSVLSCP